MQTINILDFDGSITAQQKLLATFESHIKISNLRQFQYDARLWTSPKKFAAICESAINHLSHGFALLGSGDFHHFSLGLIARYKMPLTVVLFDNHPDWIKPPHQYHCGTWVYSLARLPHVARIIIVGLESGDINGNAFIKGDVESYLNKKIVLLPHQPVEINLGDQVMTLHSKLTQNLEAGIVEIMSHISTEQVYISVDKDCLRLEDAYTNWEQGTLSIEQVSSVIRAIKNKFDIVGADTVGDYSAPVFHSPLKWIGSWLDRKVSNSSSNQLLLKRNELTNIALIQALGVNA